MADEKIEIEELLTALDDYAEATGKLEEARSEYTGYSPSYHLASWYEAQSTAKKRVTEMLNAYIDQRVQEALNVRR